MTAKRLREIVSRIRYKPGWKIRIDESGDIEILADVFDAYHPSRKPVDSPHAFVVVTPERLRAYNTRWWLGRIFDACQRLEFHECTEWFRYRGRSVSRRIFDTH